jgi:hypothetical protein
VPETLKVTVNDGDEERKAKRKKVNALKSNHKEKILEHVSRKKQESWMDFQGSVKSRFENLNGRFWKGEVRK